MGCKLSCNKKLATIATRIVLAHAHTAFAIPAGMVFSAIVRKTKVNAYAVIHI